MAKESEISAEQMNDEARKRLVSALEGRGAHLSFDDAVRDFPERLMNEKPPHVPYTFWHQLEHILRTQEDMIAYIQDPKSKMPGAKMPKVKLTDDELNAIITYMVSLKEPAKAQ